MMKTRDPIQYFTSSAYTLVSSDTAAWSSAYYPDESKMVGLAEALNLVVEAATYGAEQKYLAQFGLPEDNWRVMFPYVFQKVEIDRLMPLNRFLLPLGVCCDVFEYNSEFRRYTFWKHNVDTRAALSVEDRDAHGEAWRYFMFDHTLTKWTPNTITDYADRLMQFTKILPRGGVK